MAHLRNQRVPGETCIIVTKNIAIMIFACVDARGIFTYVKAGDPGSMGDAACWNTCSMKEKIDNNEWLITND